jgi:hypothetical protein
MRLHSLLADKSILNDTGGAITLCRVCLYLGERCVIPMGTLGVIYNVKDHGRMWAQQQIESELYRHTANKFIDHAIPQTPSRLSCRRGSRCSLAMLVETPWNPKYAGIYC